MDDVSGSGSHEEQDGEPIVVEMHLEEAFGEPLHVIQQFSFSTRPINTPGDGVTTVQLSPRDVDER